ncbi:CAMK/CAMKL/LKB protein kinase, variant [Spizellomyces punctatus DAOM BR117]|uniref:non-specific serine/threonine protein kinase n=1 Tax=Spizellomyces punctatus (strain DAOM BR117) TaxID=645134 RepID=A0A0L0H6V7_SPIPD|nr:CAMK/CAMKL/LKB protein kinase, variant [Spizellomyces punctatus DAOM BR117]KNC96972.1 CAMK/CAMKL/LKB protein kinase, variant [Spizellomyces punctatus DAOM BR117]|eukprot:XP_016605012.1 CAMK/CAMKL/LKB protein kinase, variant [Spizellomyces punctatus DAOM BR117]
MGEANDGTAGHAHRKMVSLPTILGGQSFRSEQGLVLNQKAILSAPDITRVDFVIAGPGIGTTRTSSVSETDSRREVSQTHGGQHGSRSNNSSRRPTFQGKAAMVNSVQKRMSAVDVSQLGIFKSSSARSSVVSEVAAALAASSEFSVPNSERPTILMYPRKEVLMTSTSSLTKGSSRHGSVASVNTNRVGSMGRVASYSNVKGAAGMRAASTSLRSGLSVSASVGALAASASARSLASKREAQDKIGSTGRAFRHASTGYVSTPYGSAPASASSGLAAGGSKRSSLRPPSESDIPEVPDADKYPQALEQPLEDTRILSTDESHHQPRSPSPGIFESRPISVVGDIDDSYRNNPDYYEYLMLCQRHASSNFIHKIDSSEVVWKNEAAQVKMIGRYLLGDQIGKGSFGKVKEGLCSETLQRVAVKIINKKRLRKMQGGIEGVIREIKLLRRLKHRNTITLIDVYCKVEDEDSNVAVFNWFSTIEEEPITWRFEDGTADDRSVEILKWYLVFEYCPCSLQVLLEQSDGNRLPVPRAHWYFVQLMEGLSYLHSQGVIHRDIKPGNMLITPDNVLKISDFGIAEQFSGYDGSPMNVTSFAGTHQFLSPEIAEGALSFSGEKVDVWACGITLYNMLTGRYPFEFDEDGNLLVLYEKIMAGEFDMPSGFDDDLKDLLYGMLRKNPAHRLTTDQILSHPWTRTFFHESLKPPPPILTYPTHADPSTPTESSKSTPSPTKSKDQKEKEQGNHPTTQFTPCETTLIPYLEELFADEIEEELERIGKVEGGSETNVAQSTDDASPNPRHRKRRLKHWLKHMFRSRNALSSSKKSNEALNTPPNSPTKASAA